MGLLSENKDQWQQLALELGFNFSDDILAVTESPAGQKIIKMLGSKEVPKIPDFMKGSFVEAILKRFFKGIALGKHKDFDFALFQSETSTSSSSSSTRRTVYYVNVVLFFKKNYDLGLKVYKAGFFSKLGRTVFRTQNIDIGNPELKHSLMIKGKNVSQVQALLSGQKLQQKLLEFFRYSSAFTINDCGIRYKSTGKIIAKDKAIDLMNRMAEAGECFF